MERYDEYSTLVDDLALSEQADFLPAIMAGASILGSVLGGGAKASAAGRRDDALIQNQIAAQNNRAMVDAAQHNLAAPGTLARRGIGASGLMNYSPRATEGPAAGFAQSLQDPQVREAILQRVLGESGQQLANKSYMVRPQMAQMKKAGFLEKLGGVAGLVGGLAGGMGELGLFGGNRGQMASGLSPLFTPDLRG